MKKAALGFSIVVTVICILVIVVLATGYWKQFVYPKAQERQRTRIITPREANPLRTSEAAEQQIWEESFTTIVAMEDGEVVTAVLNKELEGGPYQEQFVAYRRLAETDGPVYITFIEYDQRRREYQRAWNAPTAAFRPETVSLFTQDIIGDRNSCVLVTGMSDTGEHTMTVFRREPPGASERAFNKIAELHIDGSIVIQETERSLAYQQGISGGVSFAIAAYGRDRASANMMDQIETVYAFNQASGYYEQKSLTRIPGSQIEQRRLRELLSGVPGVFEEFINDLWYYVSPQGTLDSRQYLYFDPAGREIIFFGDEAQQVFRWQSSTRIPYGLYVISHNVSISTLRRRINIELESLDSIRVRVSEDVRMKIALSESWDGSYRRAATAAKPETGPSVQPGIDALYESTWGRIQFRASGEYTISSASSAAGGGGGGPAGAGAAKGRYVFFKAGEEDLLELRPQQGSESSSERAVYRVVPFGSASLSLSRVRLGAAGIQDLLEGSIALTPAER